MVLLIGHRGAAGHCPENTLISFRRALDLGCDMVELDVRLCRSGELVVIHDDTVDRTTDGEGKVADLDLTEIKDLDAGKGQKVPTLEEVLDLVKGGCSTNIELKGPDTAGPVGRILAERGIGPEDVLISSFMPTELYDIHSSFPGFRVGYLIDADPSGAEDFVKELGGYSVHPRFDLISDHHIGACHDLGLKVFVWTVNKKEDMRRMVRLGVDGIITDHPERVPA